VPVHEPPGHLAEAFIAYSHGNVRYELKTPYRDGTTHVVFEPLDFIARLAALVLTPRVNRTRFHGASRPTANTVPAYRRPRKAQAASGQRTRAKRPNTG